MITELELIKLIESALEIEEGIINSGNKEWHAEWDSLGHLSILVSLDKFLSGQCSNIKELSTATSIEAIKDVLKSNNLFEDNS